MSQQGDTPDPVHMDNTSERTASRLDDESDSALTSTPAAAMPIIQSRSPFFRLPLELLRMVYRGLLVTKAHIYLDSPLPDGLTPACQHNSPDIWTALLRVCRLITPEALDVLYGENAFAARADDHPEGCVPVREWHPPVIEQYLSEANRSRLRKLMIIHECCWEYYPGDSDSIWGWDSEFGSEFDYDPPNENETELEFSPYDVSGALRPHIWGPILSKLTSLTIVLTVPCSDPIVQGLIISDDRLVNENRAKGLMDALPYYRLQAGIPDSVRVRRRVRCTSHCCRCGKAQFSTKSEACVKARQYVQSVWRRALALERAEGRARAVAAAAAGAPSADQ